MQRAREGEPGRADELVLLDRQTSTYVSKDRHTTFMEIYPAGLAEVRHEERRRRRRAGRGARACPPGSTVEVTGHDPLEEASTHGDERRPERPARGA